MSQNVEIKGGGIQSVEGGRLFTGGIFVVAQTGDLDLLLRTAAGKTPRLGLRAGVSAAASVLLFQGPTTSADGAALARVNHRRTGTPPVAETLLFNGPTVSVDGVELGERYIPAGSGGSAPGGEKEINLGYILAPGTDYLIRLTPVTGTIEAELTVIWVE